MQGGDGAPGRLYHGRGHGRAGQEGREREETKTINFEAFFPYILKRLPISLVVSVQYYRALLILSVRQ